jgi:hypothetical protein
MVRDQKYVLGCTHFQSPIYFRWVKKRGGLSVIPTSRTQHLSMAQTDGRYCGTAQPPGQISILLSLANVSRLHEGIGMVTKL